VTPEMIYHFDFCSWGLSRAVNIADPAVRPSSPTAREIDTHVLYRKTNGQKYKKIQAASNSTLYQPLWTSSICGLALLRSSLWPLVRSTSSHPMMMAGRKRTSALSSSPYKRQTTQSWYLHPPKTRVARVCVMPSYIPLFY
jgi:hypothetical protein